MSQSMPCPECGDRASVCSDSRPVRTTGTIRRRRKCVSCDARWTTYEYAEKDIEALRSVIPALRQVQTLLDGINGWLTNIEHLSDPTEK